MPEYEVVWEGTLREVFYLEAESPEEALEEWSNCSPVVSESVDGDVVSVEEVENDG